MSHMSARHALLLLLMLVTPTMASNYVVQRQAAVSLLENNQHEAAFEKFHSLAQGDVTPKQKTDALEHAVKCLIILDRFEEARQLTERIPNDAAAQMCRMRILKRQGEHRKLIGTFGETEITDWPDYLKVEAYRLRARAAYLVGQGQLAADDYQKALKWTYDNGVRMQILRRLGAVYANQLDDPQQAMQVFERVRANASAADSARATVAICRMLVEKGEADAALAKLEQWIAQHDVDALPGDWYPAYVRLHHVKLLAAAGNEAKAIKRCEQALQTDHIDPRMKQKLEKELDTLKRKNESP